MTAKSYEFEGAMRTLREIGEMVPCLSAATIGKYLAAGRNTRSAMLSFDSDAARRQAGARGAAKVRRAGLEFKVRRTKG